MRILTEVEPTNEQLTVVTRNRPGVEIIRGTAGSGKTTVALLRLKTLIETFISRKWRTSEEGRVRALVLTYNRTLKGYISELAKKKVSDTGAEKVDLNVLTFSKWAKDSIEPSIGETLNIVKEDARREAILNFSEGISLPKDFLYEEVEYIRGRFPLDNMDRYLEVERTGRGVAPRVERETRESILKNVVYPYQNWLDENSLWDWNDMAHAMATKIYSGQYDIIIVDEAQDFSANQLRAVKRHLRDTHSLTFIIDTTQRIYARGYTWKECGIDLRPENSHRLKVNYRNTKQIAKLASGLVEGISIDDDGTIPDFTTCEREGTEPELLRGKFSAQLDWVISFIKRHVEDDKSVAFLHPKGGGYLDVVRDRLKSEGFSYVDIKRRSEWPKGSANIGLSSMHSAKGLEFDYVFCIGLNKEMLEGDVEEGDERFISLRRLLAMAIGRAKENVVLGYKPGEGSDLINYLDPDSYNSKDLE